MITVGAFDDDDSPHDWGDDTMWNDSAYWDPWIDGGFGPGDREKPEVAAVGVDVMSADINLGPNGFSEATGTSLAAPQVSGVAALLIDRYYWLRTNPEAVKAIIMASAIHNIEGNSRLSDQDGAGAINAAAALSIFDQGNGVTKSSMTSPTIPIGMALALPTILPEASLSLEVPKPTSENG